MHSLCAINIFTCKFTTYMQVPYMSSCYVYTYCLYKYLLVCPWEDQRENQYSIIILLCHIMSSVLYWKYSTVVDTYSTVILILVCNQCSKQPPLILLPTYMDSWHCLKWLHSTKDNCELKPVQHVVQKVVDLLHYKHWAPTLIVFQHNSHHWHLNHEASALSIKY